MVCVVLILAPVLPPQAWLEIAEIWEFVHLHRRLYDIDPKKMQQPEGLGEHWSALKQLVYGTLAYGHDFGPDWKELADSNVREETLNYIRSKRESLLARLEAAGKKPAKKAS